MTDLLKAGHLSLWGVALLLCWVCTMRLINLVHWKLYLRCYVTAPPREMLPMAPWGQWWVSWAGLACGNATLIAFGDGATRTLHIRWLLPNDTNGVFSLLRIVLAMTVLLFFLTRVAENPRYKVVWASAWCLFSLALVAVG